MVAWEQANLGGGAAEGWGWLDTRDGAEAFRLAVVGDYRGAHVLQLAAPNTVHAVPTEELLDRYARGVPRTLRFAGLTAPIDTTRAASLIGFRPRPGGPLDTEAEV